MELALARSDYKFYLEYVHGGAYVPARHTDLICEYLLEIEKGNIERLMIFLPPRHSKSMTVTETFPSYFIGKNPDRRVIVVSYSGSFAHKFGRLNKQKLIKHGSELFDVSIPRETSSSINWTLKGCRGGMLSSGFGGTIVGEGADLLLLDDPIKNRAEAQSVVYRDKIWDEWQSSLLSRLHPGGVVILIMTRWHEDDLAGRLLQHEPEKWSIINLPAEAEEGDLLGREVGEPLWPEHGFDEVWAEELKKSIGSYAWASLYQQRPAPSGGQIVQKDWWNFWCYPGDEYRLEPVQIKADEASTDYRVIHPKPLPEDFEFQAQSWDMAFSGEAGSSYVVGQVWAKEGANRFLLDQDRARRDFPSTVKAVHRVSEKWPDCDRKWIENKANGKAVIDTIKDEVSGLIPVEPEGSKVARCHAISAEVESGNVYLPHPSYAPWVWDFIQEFTEFPSGLHDDQVDTATQALRKMQSTQKVRLRAVSTN